MESIEAAQEVHSVMASESGHTIGSTKRKR
jgi:hypothetical protein